MRSAKSVLLVMCLIAVLGSLTLPASGEGLKASAKALKELTIDNVDLSKVKDGDYEGVYDAGLGMARVKVKVTGHQIAELVILKHKYGLGRKAERIVKSILAKQSLEVDTVSGATYSSKVILKATELALRQGLGN